MALSKSNGIRACEDFWKTIEIKADKKINQKLNIKFLLIKYAGDGSRQDEFAKFLINSIIKYALNKKELKDLSPDNVHDIWKKAKSRFVPNQKTGEVGELILFHLLELDKDAVQIANKMSLKTATGKHFHGVDAVHFGDDGKEVTLYLGGSKTDNDFSDAISYSIDELEKFHSNSEKKDFEISLVTGNMSDYLPRKTKDKIKNYLVGQEDDMSNYFEVHALFIGYDYVWLKKFEEKGLTGKELQTKVLEKYHLDIEKRIKLIKDKINSSSIKNKRFLFYLLPFKELQKLKKHFVGEIK